MNTAIKSNVYHLYQPDNENTKSRSMSKKDILLDKLRKCIALKHYSKATEQAYVGYVSKFIDWRMKHQQGHGAEAIAEYLTHLAVDKRVSASTQMLRSMRCCSFTSGFWGLSQARLTPPVQRNPSGCR